MRALQLAKFLARIENHDYHAWRLALAGRL